MHRPHLVGALSLDVVLTGDSVEIVRWQHADPYRNFLWAYTHAIKKTALPTINTSSGGHDGVRKSRYIGAPVASVPVILKNSAITKYKVTTIAVNEITRRTSAFANLTMPSNLYLGDSAAGTN